MAYQHNSKTIARNALFMYIRMFLVVIVSFYTTRVIFNALGIEDYGIYSAVGGIVTSLLFFSSTLANASQRFFATDLATNDFSKLRKTFSIMMFLFVIIAVVVLVLCESGGLWFLYNMMTIPKARMTAALWVFQSSTLIFIITILTAPFQALIIAHEKMDIYAYVGIVDALFKLLIAFIVMISNYDNLITYSVLMLLGSFISNSVYVIYCRYSYSESRLYKVYDHTIIKNLFGYSTWTMLGCFSYVCNSQGLNILLNIFFGPVVNAAYSISNQIKATINQFASNFFVAVRPSLIKDFAAHDENNTIKLFYTSTKMIFFLLFIIILPVFLNIEEILNIWLGSSTECMISFVRLTLIFAVLLSISDPISTIIQAANKVKTYTVNVEFLTLLSLPLSFIAIKLGGDPNSVFAASIIMFSIAHFVRLNILRKTIKCSILDYVKIIFVPIFITIIISLILGFLFHSIEMNGLSGLILNLAFDFLIACLSCYMILLNKQEKSMIKEFVLKKIRK